MSKVPVKGVKELLASGSVVQCDGKSRAWGAKFKNEEHIARDPHPPCRLCGADMGCVRCSGPTYDLLCNRCRDWGHVDALNRHGRPLTTAVERAKAVAFLRAQIKAAL